MGDKLAKIAKLAEKGKYKNLLPMLKDKDNNVRVAAMRAMAASQDPGFAQEISFALNDPSPEVRQAAAYARGGVATAREVELIKKKMAVETDEKTLAAYHEALKNAKGGKVAASVYNASKF